jgi:cardiolipin synthase
LFTWGFWGPVLAVANIVLACLTTAHAVLWKRDYRSVIGWVGVAWMAPLIGSIGYFCFGINRLRRKTEKLLQQAPAELQQRPELLKEEIAHVEHVQWRHPNLSGLAKTGKSLTGRQLLPGNHVEPLMNGEETYPAMLDAIDSAQSTVCLLSYIFDSDRVGNQFLDALRRAVRRGVEVRVLIDDVGSNYSRPNMVKRLRAEGIAVAAFMPTYIPRLPTINLRNHRKILVADGRLGFIGGTNIREGHCLELHPKYPVQCLHFRLQGPVVAHLQSAFVHDWAFTTGEVLSQEKWFPQLERVGQVWARGIEHGPDEQFEKLVDMTAAALAVARQRVRIVTPYFLPRPSLIQALYVTALRGVAVEVYLPSENNIRLVQWASTAHLWQMLEKGVRIFYTQPPFDHTKLMIVDNMWTLIGSTNWDPRSFRLNFEFNVECYSADFAERMSELVDRKAAGAREVTLQEVDSRSYPIRLRDGLARLLTPVL